MSTSRRNFLKNTLAAGTGMTLPAMIHGTDQPPPIAIDDKKYVNPVSLNLAPANWIWFPSQRCLPNTVILFRRSFQLRDKPAAARGWILGDSRYKLYANGERIQFGPAPADPRWAEADPVDLTAWMRQGENVVGAEVLYYGTGDGTWPIGKPGFIFFLEVVFASGEKQLIVSDEQWETSVANSWRPGQHKRWYLRALQESFDATQHPYGWNTPEFSLPGRWTKPMVVDCPADKPVICSTYRDYLYDVQGIPAAAALRERSISPAREYTVPVKALAESMWLHWKKSSEEYFSFVTPDAFDVVRDPCHQLSADNHYEIRLRRPEEAALLTFEFAEQVVGFPYFTIQAPAGTVVELLVHEAHAVGGDALINTHFHAWTRFTCKEGVNVFETFDYESLRWLQLHIHGDAGTVQISSVGVRRRMFDWKHQPAVNCDDARLQKVVNAGVNTLYNCAIETIVDGMGRERQQYSGDVGHVLHAVFLTMGEPELAARFINTYSQGITEQGFFLDCWPAYDRLARIMERELGLTQWGPLLDHGVGFNFDCYHYYLYTGEVDSIREVFPRLIRFFNYLTGIKRDGLLPVEGIGVPVVWMDHHAYAQQRHKQCAFNLYAAAMMEHALFPLCQAFREEAMARRVAAEGRSIRDTAIARFWSSSDRLFINNLPWAAEENVKRMCDRSLATALLFDQCPRADTSACVEALDAVPGNMGLSYPANANWRYWALARFGRDTFIREMRDQWSAMESVTLNNTLAEEWQAKPDANAQWSHCALSPLFGMHMCVAGIRPLTPGFREIEIAPVVGDLKNLSITTHTVMGQVLFALARRRRKITATVQLPAGMTGRLRWKGEVYPLKAGSQAIDLPA